VPDLLINSLTQHNAQSGRPDCMDPRHLSALTIQENSAQKFLCERAVPLSIQRDFVFLLDLEAWMSQPLREITVIR
jgi:hypothetical protein